MIFVLYLIVTGLYFVVRIVIWDLICVYNFGVYIFRNYLINIDVVASRKCDLGVHLPFFRFDCQTSCFCFVN